VIELTRVYSFSASHRLHVDSLSEEENQQLFGKCNNPYGHGHNYVLHVSVTGDPATDSGMVVDRDEMDRVVRDAVLPRIDRKDMNAAVQEFADLTPTTENLSRVIGQWLSEAWAEFFPNGQPRLSRIRLQETGRNSFELRMGS
jgi:6-pyruvoyltetrahydropterin/6-carboxytetrahydropterin synthase